MKIILISPKNRTVYNFRGDLIKKWVSAGREVIVTGPNDTGVDKITSLGARFVQISMTKNGVNAAEDIRYMKALTKLMKLERPDVMLAYTIKPVVYGAPAAKKAGVKSINVLITGAGYTFTAKTAKAKIIKKIVCFLYKRAFKCADTAIFQNNDDKIEFVENKLVNAEKCRVVNGSGVNLDKFPVVPLPERTTFFMLSRVMKSKGIIEFLQASRIVKQKRPDVRIMLLGAVENIQDSLTHSDLKPYIDEGIIEHFGETDDVASYYSQCSVYVLPSYREGTPRTVLEAMSMGRAIITTDVPGCRETVKDGYNGYLVPPENSSALAEKMIYLADNHQLVEQMGKNSRAYCEEKFDVNAVNNMMNKYINV